ncbi:HTH-type transcriptional repressor PurR [Streptomyces tanashiensis]
MAAGALQAFRGTDLPLVMLDSDPADPGASAHVNLDVADGMRRITRHLLDLGHRSFLHMASAVPSWTFDVRAAALAHTLRGAGLRTVRAPLNVDDAREAAHLALSAPGPRPTAVICDDDILAVGVGKAAHRLGLRVPDDLSVTGFDEMTLATAVEPELTTVRLPAEEFGDGDGRRSSPSSRANRPRRSPCPWTSSRAAPRAPHRPPEPAYAEGPRPTARGRDPPGQGRLLLGSLVRRLVRLCRRRVVRLQETRQLTADDPLELALLRTRTVQDRHLQALRGISRSVPLVSRDRACTASFRASASDMPSRCRWSRKELICSAFPPTATEPCSSTIEPSWGSR